jgi:CheY-like chemotaxis protein
MSRERILVIDDSPTLLTLVEAALAKAGFAPLTPQGRSPAVAVLEDRPKLVLLGTVSDAASVAGFYAALREDDGLHAVPVVLLSLAEGGTDAPAAPRPREVVDVINKPFSPDALLAVVEHALKSPRDPDAPRPATDLGSLSLVPAHAGGEATIETEAWSEESATAAALSGDLGLISLADILGLLDAEAQTGVLSIRRADAHLRIYFSGGRIDLATAQGVPEEFLLGRFLVRGGALAAPTLASALEARAAAVGTAAPTPPLLGKFLVDRGFIGQPALRRILALQTAALIFESLRWGAGRFGFEAVHELPAVATEAGLALAVPPLLLEGFRRVDEWRLIEREVGDFDAIFLRDEDRVGGFGRGRLTRDEISILDLCDGRRTVREIIDRSQLGAFDTTKMLYRLSRTRLVRRRVAPVAMPA